MRDRRRRTRPRRSVPAADSPAAARPRDRARGPGEGSARAAVGVGGRIDPELVGQHRPRPLERRQGLPLPVRSVQGEHQLLPEPFAQRVACVRPSSSAIDLGRDGRARAEPRSAPRAPGGGARRAARSRRGGRARPLRSARAGPRQSSSASARTDGRPRVDRSRSVARRAASPRTVGRRPRRVRPAGRSRARCPRRRRARAPSEPRDVTCRVASGASGGSSPHSASIRCSVGTTRLARRRGGRGPRPLLGTPERDRAVLPETSSDPSTRNSTGRPYRPCARDGNGLRRTSGLELIATAMCGESLEANAWKASTVKRDYTPPARGLHAPGSSVPHAHDHPVRGPGPRPGGCGACFQRRFGRGGDRRRWRSGRTSGCTGMPPSSSRCGAVGDRAVRTRGAGTLPRSRSISMGAPRMRRPPRLRAERSGRRVHGSRQRDVAQEPPPRDGHSGSTRTSRRGCAGAIPRAPGPSHVERVDGRWVSAATSRGPRSLRGPSGPGS